MNLEGMSVFSGKFLILVVIGLMVVLGIGFLVSAPPSGPSDNYKSGDNNQNVSEMKIVLPFGDVIPNEYTKYGEDLSPRVEFEEVPEEAETIALVMDDPDAQDVAGKIWVHWTIWNIPANESIPQNVSITPRVEEVEGALQGENDFGDIGYGGPKPPSGTHSYRFRAYALDSELDLNSGATRSELLDAIEGKVVAKDKVEADYTK